MQKCKESPAHPLSTASEWLTHTSGWLYLVCGNGAHPLPQPRGAQWRRLAKRLLPTRGWKSVLFKVASIRAIFLYKALLRMCHKGDFRAKTWASPHPTPQGPLSDKPSGPASTSPPCTFPLLVRNWRGSRFICAYLSVSSTHFLSKRSSIGNFLWNTSLNCRRALIHLALLPIWPQHCDPHE